MSMESDLQALLAAICPRVYPDVANPAPTKPYLTWQGIGGAGTVRFLDNTPADKRNTLMQINVWSLSRLEALALIRQIEDVLCATPAFVAKPLGDPLSTYEPDGDLYGCIQRFSIWSAR